eukprot:g7370.t1
MLIKLLKRQSTVFWSSSTSSILKLPRPIAHRLRVRCFAASSSDTKEKPLKVAEDAITPKSEDYSQWYLDLISKAELADYGPVRGTMVIRPYGYAIWEALQKELDKRFKETGHENMYFPQLIPYSYIQKEKNHVEGFKPELAIVTQGGGKELEEPLVVRPTSETIVNHMIAKWIQSYRDLPLLLNQWVNVHRWELRPRLFIRTSEFLWQEGHTAHATAEEATEEALRMIEIYRQVARDFAAIPVIIGRKSKLESFAGAKTTYTIEAMMGDKKALQAGTSHDLSTNFAEAFGTKYENPSGERLFVHQTSWGVSTRLIGGIIMAHGDDQGLRLPPKLAPIQVVIVPIIPKESQRQEILKAANTVQQILVEDGIRVKLDDNKTKSPGWRYHFWEMKGVPIRIELGPRDLANQSCVTCRRDKIGRESKEFGIPANDSKALLTHIHSLLDSIQSQLLAEAESFQISNIIDVTSFDDLKQVINEGKWARGPWCGTDEDEERVKLECQATLRCFPFDQPSEIGPCLMTGKPAKEVAIFAKAY